MNDVYYPIEIPDTPLPGQDPLNLGGNGSQGSNGVYVPTAIEGSKMPRKKIATETISASLNTKSRKILAQFEFTESGAIQIGKYIPDENGDIRITPAGIIARNKGGEQTVGIDADTGDATFKGIVQAGSFIAGDGNIIIDEDSGDEGRGRILFMDTDRKVAILLGWGDFG